MTVAVNQFGATKSFRDIGEAPVILAQLPADHYDLTKSHEIHTEKAPFKFVACTICRRPMVVNTFYVPAWAKCSSCGGESDTREKASIGVPQAGKTDPALAVDLAACLINRLEFEVLNCPFGHGEMELKSVSHNDNYGPFHYETAKNGHRVRVQDSPGETTMHQCNECLVTISMSTTAQSKFKRQNEVGTRKNVNGWATENGVRDD